MCGISGYIGYDHAFMFLFESISKLLNRGYDSVGICSIHDNKFILHKYASTENELADKKILSHFNEHIGTVGIAHSRWATTGAKTDANAHPHIDYLNTISLVHNGIIENYEQLKTMLLSQNYKFKSQTDTEVIANLISYYYNCDKDPVKAILATINGLEGTYALAILFSDYPNNLFCTRKGSPLLIGFSANKNFAMVASEKYGFNSKINDYICVDNNDLVVLTKESNRINMHSFQNKIYNQKILDVVKEHHTPDPHPHWTLKEIYDQIISSTRAIGMGGRILNKSEVKLGGLEKYKDEIVKTDNIILLGCGTSYNSGLFACHLFKKICNLNIVQVFDGSEFSEHDIPKIGSTTIIFISQSGETKDLHNCLEICDKYKYENHVNLLKIGVINTVDSMIAREVNCGVYLNAGRENAVASTKSFSSQIIVLTLIAIWIAQHKKIHEHVRCYYIEALMRLQFDIEKVIDDNIDICKQIAEYLIDKNSLFILGKHTMESIAYEGALKIKEIGYIHAEGYSSSALKHGPYSLITTGMPIILLTPHNEYFNKNQSIMEEIHARDACVIGLSDVDLSNKYHFRIKIPNNKCYIEIISIIPLQLIAYYLAVFKGHNPDFPRHLAKCVTTD